MALTVGTILSQVDMERSIQGRVESRLWRPWCRRFAASRLDQSRAGGDGNPGVDAADLEANVDATERPSVTSWTFIFNHEFLKARSFARST